MTYDTTDWGNLYYTHVNQDMNGFNVLFSQTIDRISGNAEHYNAAKLILEEYCSGGLSEKLLESILALVRLEPDSLKYKVMLFTAAVEAGQWDLAAAVLSSNISNSQFRCALSSFLAVSWTKLNARAPNMFRELLCTNILRVQNPAEGNDHLSAFAHILSGDHLPESHLSALARPEFGAKSIALIAFAYQERYEWTKAMQVWSDIIRLEPDFPDVEARIRATICRTCASFDELMRLLGSLADRPQLQWAIRFAKFHGMILIKGRKAAYMVNPKVGSTSILSKIFAANGGDKCDPSQYHLETKILARLDEQPTHAIEEVLNSPDWMRFSFVRHPVHRFVSGYLNKFTKLFSAPSASFQFLQAAGYGTGIPQYAPVKARADYRIEDIVNFIENHAPQDQDLHFSLQSNLLGLDHINYGFIGKFEQFGEDLQFISDAIGVDLTSSAKASHRTGSANFVDQVLDDGLRQRITSYYRKDFENFGYDV